MSSYRMKYKIGLVEHSVVVPEDISSIPLGTILPYSANTLNPPSGYLFCDGSAVSRSMYPDLFALIGTLYGSGDGSTTFNLPNLLGGKFLEGTNSAGTSKNAGLPNITGSFYSTIYTGSNSGYALPVQGATGSFYSSNSVSTRPYFVASGNIVSGDYKYSATLDASRSSSVYKNNITTVQPSSFTVRYIIKAFTSISNDSSLIDVTQYASSLNQKYDVGSDWCYIYPNGGTAANPGSLAKSSRYVEDNPFPGYTVGCHVEILYHNEWADVNWICFIIMVHGFLTVFLWINSITILLF